MLSDEPMAQFRFRLQTLLRYRQHLVEQAEHALAQLVAEELAVMESLERCRATLYACSEQGAAMKAHQLQAQDAYRQHLAEQIRMLERQLQTIQAARRQQQERLVERMQDCDVLERLRERQFQEYLDAERRGEQQQLDDIAARKRHFPSIANSM